MTQHAKIACLVGEEFEDSELRVPYDRLKQAGHRVELIGAKAGVQVSGKQGKEKITIERSIEDAQPQAYDLLLIPGGRSPTHLRSNPRFVDFVRQFDRLDRPIAAICHGPQLMISAGIVDGRTLTSWPSVQRELKDAGAHVKDEEVVIDGNFITSRKPEDLDAFSRVILRTLEKHEGSFVGSGAGSERQPQA